MNSPRSIRIIAADLSNKAHANGLIDLLNCYADSQLAPEVVNRLPSALQAFPTAQILLAFDEDDRPVGTAVCFLGFSTWQAKPILNLHDLVVAPNCRGQGVGNQLLSAVEEKARELGCCRVSLEVMESNPRAKALYHRFGFPDLAEVKKRKFFLEKDVS